MIVVPPLARHTATVIVLHGLGETGSIWAGLISLIHSFVPNVKFIIPQAITQKVTMRGNMHMPAWFDILGHTESDAEDEKVNKLIDKEISAGIQSKKIVLVGISQGGAMALFTGLQYNRSLGGIVALSCWLPLRNRFPEALSEASKSTKILQCHGSADATVPYTYGKKSAELMEGFGLDVQFQTYQGVGHTPAPQQMIEVAMFLKSILS